MNIIELAREAGLYLDGENTQYPLYVLTTDELTCFAALVRAEALEEAATKCEGAANHEISSDFSWASRTCAAAIRQLKEKT